MRITRWPSHITTPRLAAQTSNTISGDATRRHARQRDGSHTTSLDVTPWRGVAQETSHVFRRQASCASASGAARILADVGDVARFPDRSHFASWTGTAPIDASSGRHIRHRLSRAGNRRINHVLYMAGIVQLRNDTTGRRYYRRRLADGKTPMEAMRCLRRRLSDVVYRQLTADLARSALQQTGSGGHSGATLKSGAADLTPDIGSSDKPLPEPAVLTLPPPPPAGNPARPEIAAPHGDAPEVSAWSAPPDERR
jgi:Transposase IS116/IS110/IS902 family